jgi:hypothetical protein
MRKLIPLALAALTLVLAAPAFAGHNTYYRIKGGSATVSVAAASELSGQYGIDVARRIGPLSLKRGGSVYHSNNSLTADFTSRSKIVVSYDTRGANGHKGGVTTLTIKRLSIRIGGRNSFVIGRVSGSSTVPGVTVRSGEIRVFNITGGKVKKSSAGGVKYVFNSNKVTFNSALTNMLNSFGTPIGNKKASAKVNLGSIAVKVR